MNNPSRPISLGTALKVAVGAAHAESAAIGTVTALLCSTTDCHVVVGSAPVATTSDTFLPAKTPLRISCNATDLVSVIQDTAGGQLYVTPGA
jgi:hypothetical protein